MSLLEKYTREAGLMVKVCARLSQRLYVTSQGGNLAWRLEPNLLVITPTQMNKGDVRGEDLVFIDLEGKVIEGKHRPTGETPMYLTFFKQRSDILTVIHCHPPAACAVAITQGKNWLMRPLYPEAVIEIGPVPVVPYGQPLTQALAHNFEPFLPKYNSFIMENHGLVTMSRGDIEWTMGNIELLEMSAQSIVMALQMGGIKELDRQAVTDLGNVSRVRHLPLFGAPGINDSLEGLYFDSVQ